MKGREGKRDELANIVSRQPSSASMLVEVALMFAGGHCLVGSCERVVCDSGMTIGEIKATNDLRGCKLDCGTAKGLLNERDRGALDRQGNKIKRTNIYIDKYMFISIFLWIPFYRDTAIYKDTPT